MNIQATVYFALIILFSLVLDLDYDFNYDSYYYINNDKVTVMITYPLPQSNNYELQSLPYYTNSMTMQYWQYRRVPPDSFVSGFDSVESFSKLPHFSSKELVGSILEKSEIQNIPPSFTPMNPELYLKNGHQYNETRREEEKNMKRWTIRARNQEERRQQYKKLNELRKLMNTTIPYTEDELRQAVYHSSNRSSISINRPRYEFYASDPEFENYTHPLLMDGFSYCEGTTLVVEALFTIRYMYIPIGRLNTLEYVKDKWICEHHGKNASNIFRYDSYKQMIITEYKFMNSCHLGNDHSYILYDITHPYQYHITLEFLPDFTQQRYYLSLCTSIEKAPPNQVLAYIHHHFFHGVQHFAFYLNGQFNFWKKVLQPYANTGLVDLIDFTFPHHRPFFEQTTIINSCARRYRYTSQFMIFSDVDEFFLPINTTWRIIDVIKLYNQVFPTVDAFSVRNTFYSCPYHPRLWNTSMQLDTICSERCEKVVKGERHKNVIRLRTVEYVQVHYIGYGDRLYIDHHLDMVMVHFKPGFRRQPGIPIKNNPFVSQALHHALF